MHIKTTDELNHEIKSATDIEDFLTKNKEHLLTDTLSDHLNTLLMQKGVSRIVGFDNFHFHMLRHL